MSVGNDTSTDDEKSIFLKYLNQAHYELYNHTASVNEDLVVNEAQTTTANSSDVTLQNNIFCVNAVFIPDRITSLESKNLMEYVAYKKEYGASSPSIYMFRKNTISIYPIVANKQYDLDIWYTPQPEELTETTPENDIPYPASFHNILVDGALYYLFLDEEGYQSTERSRNHTMKWEKGKQDLYAYLFHRSGQITSSFSNVL